jgi:5-methylcytosine-specific restriction endonuclease McrA
MESILVKNKKIHLDPINKQVSPLGRPFRLSGISIDYSKAPKYINGNARHCTSYFFIYTDTKELFGFYFDEFDNYVCKLDENKINELNKDIVYKNEILQYHLDLENPLWINKRKEILKRDNNKCKCCGSKKYLHIHHLLYKNKKKPWDYDNNDLITLCVFCHKKEHDLYGTGNFIRALELKSSFL